MTVNLIVAIISLLCPPVGFILSLVCLTKDFKHWKTYVFCIAWFFANLAYCYDPTVITDLTRYKEYAGSLENVSLFDALTAGDKFASGKVYGFVIICWIISRTGDLRLLPALSTFCVYYIGLYITCRIGYDTSVKKKNINKYIYFILLTVSFYGIVNNVRNIFAFCLVSMAVFREFYEKKRNWLTIFLYVFPVFVHISALVLVLIRFCFKLTKKMKLLMILMTLFVPGMLNILSARIGSYSSNILINIIQRMIISGNNYFVNADAEWAQTVQTSGSQALQKIVYMSVALIFVIASLTLQKRKKRYSLIFNNHSNDVDVYADYVFYLVILTLSCLPMVMPEYWRFISVTVLCGSSIMLQYQRLTFKGDDVNKIVKQVVFAAQDILALGCFALAIRNLFLYADFLQVILKTFICNPIVILLLKSMGMYNIIWS